MKTLDEMTAEIRECNIAHGWRDPRNTWGDYVALLHSEVSEILEAYRDWRLDDATFAHPTAEGLPKPEGVGSECADVLIRILDMADVFGIHPYDMECKLVDVDGLVPDGAGWGTFGDWNAWLHRQAATLYTPGSHLPGMTLASFAQAVFAVPQVLRALIGFCEAHEVDLDAEYERKIAYNRTRPYQHGGRTLVGDK